MIADIFITVKPEEKRSTFLFGTLRSLTKTTKRDLYRLTIIEDGFDEYGSVGMCLGIYRPDYVLKNMNNMGLGPSINMALAHVDALKRWDTNPSPLTVYVQDDVKFSDGWLEKLSLKFLLLEKPLNLGFASGIECIEHPVKKDIGNGMVTKDWIRATCMLARHDYWMSMWPISRIDPETGRERGKPDNGMGSSVDWWFIRNHPNSVTKTGRTNLVIPGLLQHTGYKDSTWLKRELPESESDKRIIDGRDK